MNEMEKLRVNVKRLEDSHNKFADVGLVMTIGDELAIQHINAKVKEMIKYFDDSVAYKSLCKK